MLNIPDIKNLDFKSGVFTKVHGFITQEKSKYLSTSLEKTTIDENITKLQLTVKNISNNSISLNSLMVADFILPNRHPKEILQNGWGQSSFSGYKNRITPTKRPLMFLKRDYNPFSFDKEFGHVKGSLISEWYTQLVSSETSLVIGAITTKNQFTQIYLREDQTGIHVRITCQLDGIEIKPQEYIKSEEIALISGETTDSLETFANLIKETSMVNPLPNPIRGLCCAYYYQGNKVDEKYVMDQLYAIDKSKEALNFSCLEIDEGYCVKGDWMDSTKQFPSGMSHIAIEIKKRNMKAGIWIAPFIASTKSKLYKEHPDWFLKDIKGRNIEARFTSPFDFLPVLSLRVLDITNPHTQKFLENTIKTYVSWGFDYIKVDFTYPICFSVAYENQMTRAQALRLGFEIIKKAAGKEVLIQTGITQLSPLVGLVDYVRVGLDTINPFVCKLPIINRVVNTYMLKENLRNANTRQFLNNKVWVNDADCLICRPNTGLSIKDIQKHYDFISNYEGSIWVGDNLAKLKPKIINRYIVPLLKSDRKS